MNNDSAVQQVHRDLEQQLGDLSQQTMLRSSELFKNFGESVQVVEHDYGQLDLFTDEALIRLLSNHPRRRLQCFTMGDDPTKPEEWQAVCIARVSGEKLLESVKNGKIWINVTNVDEYDPRYRAVVEDMYQYIEKLCPTVEGPELNYNTLVLASPGTQFYYHVNPENNMLWNMRGNLTLSVLPAMDFRFLSKELLEEIFALEASGSIPYRPEFEVHAETKQVGVNDCAWWPQTAPIRMQYQDFCVSFVTSYYCPVRHRRELVQLANRYLLRSLGIKNSSIKEHGISSEIKQFWFRALRHFFPTRKAYDFTDSYITKLRVNPSAENCLETLPELVIPEFSKYSGMTGED